MGFLDELSQGMQQFNAGVQQYGITKGIGEAQEQLKQLNATAMDEMEKRAAQQQIANNLTLQLSSLQAPLGLTQQASGAIKPADITNPEQAIMQGVLTNSQKLQQIGQQAQQLVNAPVTQEAERGRQFQRQMQKEKYGYEFALKGLEASQKGKELGLKSAVPFHDVLPGAAPTEEDAKIIKKSSAINTSLFKTLDSIEEMVKESGTEVLPLGNRAYQLRNLKKNLVVQLKEAEKLGALTGPDVEILEEIVPDVAAFRTGKFKAQAETFRKEYMKRAETTAAAYGYKAPTQKVREQIKGIANWIKENPNSDQAAQAMQLYMQLKRSVSPKFLTDEELLKYE